MSLGITVYVLFVLQYVGTRKEKKKKKSICK